MAQILRNGKEFLPEHEHLAGADKAGDAHAEIGVEQPQPGHGHIVGDEERVAGHHHCAENEEKAEVLPPELIVHQRKGRADGKHQTDHRSERRHDEGVEHIAQHGRLMHGVLEVLRIGKAARQQPRQEKFRRSFEGAQNTVDHREDQHQAQSDGHDGYDDVGRAFSGCIFH